MARYLYIDPNETSGLARATALGCGWLPAVPPQFTIDPATLPVIVINGAGQSVILSDTPPKTAAQVATAAAPIVAAEQAAQDAQATQDGNALNIRQMLTLALANNRATIQQAKPATAAAQASAAYDQSIAALRQNNLLIRIALGQFDGTN